MDSPRDFADEDKALIIEDTCSCNTPSSPSKERNIHFHVLFTLLNITIACISVYSNASAHRHPLRVSGWDTELYDARRAIEYEERSYTGALTYDSEKKEIVKLNDSDLEFFGPPSTQIDDAWDYLLHAEFPTMTEDEAAPFGSDLQPFPSDHKYHFEPDMFHNLHCINAIRMKFNQHVYGDSNESEMKHHHELPASVVGPNYETTHYEHCLDRLRQAIMCHGDLTPSPMYIFEGFPVALGKSGKHTCRRFEPIREWMDRRGEEKGFVG